MKGEDLVAITIGEIVEPGALAGAATLVWRDGEVVQNPCVGFRDVEGGCRPSATSCSASRR
jgi:hypothetical protein